MDLNTQTLSEVWALSQQRYQSPSITDVHRVQGGGAGITQLFNLELNISQTLFLSLTALTFPWLFLIPSTGICTLSSSLFDSFFGSIIQEKSNKAQEPFHTESDPLIFLFMPKSCGTREWLHSLSCSLFGGVSMTGNLKDIFVSFLFEHDDAPRCTKLAPYRNSFSKDIDFNKTCRLLGTVPTSERREWKRKSCDMFPRQNIELWQ